MPPISKAPPVPQHLRNHSWIVILRILFYFVAGALAIVLGANSAAHNDWSAGNVALIALATALMGLAGTEIFRGAFSANVERVPLKDSLIIGGSIGAISVFWCCMLLLDLWSQAR